MINTMKDVIKYIKEIFASKELLLNLTSKELKLKYRNSVLGFLWSFLNPILQLIVYTLVFRYFMKNTIHNFTVYLLCGLLPWQFFQISVQGSTGSIISNANLIKKVYFPREILPLSLVLSNFVNFIITLVILFFAVILTHTPIGLPLIELPLVLLLLLLLTIGLSLILSCLNVLYRDIQHFVEVLFMLWFYLTPIVYNLDTYKTGKVAKYKFLLNLNPMKLVTDCVKNNLYSNSFADPKMLLSLLILDLILIIGGLHLFRKIEVVFAEEI
jgi:lipopolysaccharide transport system permease protein